MPLRLLLSRASTVVRIESELNENCRVLNHGAKRAQKPRQRVEQVLLVLGVRDKADAVGEVSGQREEEEQKREA